MKQTTLPAHYYTDAAFYRAELERFYFRRWIHAGRAESLRNPGDYFLFALDGESVIVTVDATGSLRAFSNVCRHRGTRLCSEAAGAFPNGRIRCPYHAWTYGLDGALLYAPQMGEDFQAAEYPLRPVHVDVWAGNVFLNFNDDARSLREQLGLLPEKFAAWNMADLRVQKRIRYDVRANWKLIVANYNECLHCPVLHPALNRLTNYLGADNQPPSRDYIGGSMGFREGVETMSLDGKRSRDYLPGLDAQQRAMVAYYAVFPNLLLSLHPDYVMTHTLIPKAVDQTEIVCEWLFAPQEIKTSDVIDFWDLTNREDWAISEQAQLGIASRGYVPGPYSPREELLAAFDDLVREE